MQNVVAETQEDVERKWYRRVATVLMVGTILIGAVPLVKTALFPVERNR
jgi:hypothetical protein